jgi:hypothetical protein
MIEIVIVVLLSYAIDFLRLGDNKNFAVFVAISVVLVVVVFLIQRASMPREKT